MKKVFTIALAVLMAALFVVGCSKDGSDNPLVGKWQRNSDYTYKTTITFNSDGTYDEHFVWNQNTGEANEQHGTWSYDEMSRILVKGSGSYYVHTLTSSTLVLLYMDGDTYGTFTKIR